MMKTLETMCACVVLLAFLAGCGRGGAADGKGKDAGKAPASPMRVRTAVAVKATIKPTIRVTGTLHADESVTVSAKVAGRIISISHDLGDRVNPTTQLAAIDPIDYVLAVKEKELAVQATLAKVGLTAFPQADFDAAEVPTVKRAALQRANAKAKHDRLKKLFDQEPPLISEQEYSDALTAFEVAQSAYDVELLEARACLAEAATRRAELGVAQQRLEDTKIIAPVDESPRTASAVAQGGSARQYKVAERLVAVGEYVREGAPLFRLLDDDPVKLRAMVPERFARQVQKDLRASMSAQGHDQPFEGVVSRVSPQVDEASRTFPIEVLIRNPDGRLKPGAFAVAWIELREELAVALVPAEAVVSFAGVHRIFVAGDGKAAEVRVELGERQEDMIMVTKGLSGGEAVILSPPGQMVDGSPITVESTAKEVAKSLEKAHSQAP
jgi:multidrug efflux pump subunit AcrA (membrane-fusion protein)